MATYSAAQLLANVQEQFSDYLTKLYVVLALGILPLGAVLAYWSYHFNELDCIREDVEMIALRAPRSSIAMQEWEGYKKTFGGSQPFYIENTVGAIYPLKKERNKLAAFLKLDMFTNQAELQRRNQVITSEKNRFRFREKILFENKQWKESLLAQLSSIEVSEQDVATFFSYVEGEQKDAPQLLVKECHLFTDGKTLRMKTEIVKREVKE